MPLTTASFMLRSSLALSFPPQKRMDITYLHWLQSLLHRFLHTNYVDGPHLVSSQQDYGIELLGPVTVDPGSTSTPTDPGVQRALCHPSGHWRKTRREPSKCATSLIFKRMPCLKKYGHPSMQGIALTCIPRART